MVWSWRKLLPFRPMTAGLSHSTAFRSRSRETSGLRTMSARPKVGAKNLVDAASLIGSATRPRSRGLTKPKRPIPMARWPTTTGKWLLRDIAAVDRHDVTRDKRCATGTQPYHGFGDFFRGGNAP